MRLSFLAFTQIGYELAKKTAASILENRICDEAKVLRVKSGELKITVKAEWEAGCDLVFIGAIGIAFRAVAPYIGSKLSDRAVLVMDEAGQYVIPVLSGHVGGADDLAYSIAKITGPTPVITTASDINGIEAIDTWAVKNGMAVMNKDMIKVVSEKRLSGEILAIHCMEYDEKIIYEGWAEAGDINRCDVILYGGCDTSVINDLVNDHGTDALILVKRYLVLGIGCKKDTPTDKLDMMLQETLRSAGLDIRLVKEIATIDIKADEPCIKSICDRYRCKLSVYSAGQLSEAPGDFTSSEFVEQTVGVDNVCERAVVTSGGELTVKKQAKDGVTVAVGILNGKHDDKLRKIYIVGIGPGGGADMTVRAADILNDCDVIVGFETYLKLVRDRWPEKEYISTSMKQETDRCRRAYEAARDGRKVAVICSGDAGIYGMASLMYELLPEYNRSEGAMDDGVRYELEIIPGVTAATGGAALLGAPIGHDFCVISLSDLLTPWEVIEKRLICAAKGDYNIVLYNPASHKRNDYPKKVVTLLKDMIEDDRICGIARLIGREGEEYRLCTFDKLKDEDIDMFSTVFIGSSKTKVIEGHMVTPRGYETNAQ